MNQPLKNTVVTPIWKINKYIQREKPIKERFFEKVNKDGPIQFHVKELGKCWEWIACISPFGNSLDRDQKGRTKNGSKTHPERYKRGQEHHKTKLSDNDVLNIKKLIRNGNYSQEEIGRMFSIDQSVISDIKLNKIWKHIS